MADNESIVFAMLFAVEMSFRAVRWTTVAENEADKEFVDSIFDDMDLTHDELMSQIVSMLTYGWQFSEVVYKRRLGPKGPKKHRSKFSDGMIGVKTIANRPQETLYRWEIDKNGKVKGLYQWPMDDTNIRFIPLKKGMLFRPFNRTNSPEGRSALRGAYRSWYFLKHLQELESMTIERDLTGLPMFKVPAGEIEDATKRKYYMDLLRRIRRNNMPGILLPSETRDGMPSHDMKLLSASSSQRIETDPIITRYEVAIARAFLADFITLGQTSAGSFSMAKVKLDMFMRALGGWMEGIAETINRELLPKIWEFNGKPMETVPKRVPGRINPVDLKEIGEFIERMNRAGVPVRDRKTEDHLRRESGLPEREEEVEATPIMKVGSMPPSPVPGEALVKDSDGEEEVNEKDSQEA